jgi:uncharacterized membrane protein YqjE
MSAEPTELPGEEAEFGWKERIAALADAGSALLQTRVAIVREELAVKVASLLRGLVAVAIGLFLGAGALLLLAAFLAALLAQWFGSVALGILGALVLYAVGTAAAVMIALNALKRVKPAEFPASAEELRRDWRALRESWSAPTPPGESEAASPGAPVPAAAADRRSDDRVESLEDRYRAGAE